MSDNALERASIQVRVVKSGRRNSQLQFVLVRASNEVLLVSETFQSANPPRREQPETAALESLLQMVRDQGWQIVARPTEGLEWWAFRFARGNHEDIQREKEWVGLTSTPASTPPQSSVPPTAPPMQREREVVFVEKNRGCLGGCLGGVGRLVLGVIGLIVVIGVIAGVATDSSNTDDDPSVNDQGSNDQGSPEAAGGDPDDNDDNAKVGSGENPAPIGTSVTGDGLEVKVHSADLSDTAGVFAGAEPGVMYLTLDVTIRNVSDDKKSFNAFYWSGKDIVNGYAFDDALFAGDSVSQLSAGDLQPSDLIRGEVVLMVRDDSQKIRIKYDTSPIGGANLYWLFEAP